MSRVNASPGNLDNHPADISEERYQQWMYFPHLHVCLEQLGEKYTALTATAYALSSLVPLYVIDADMSSLRAKRMTALFREVLIALKLS